MVLNTIHYPDPINDAMKMRKVFVGGRVDANLKRRFLRELQKFNRQNGTRITQREFLEKLLQESVTIRKSLQRKRKSSD